ncbi:hypothetical protein N8H72_08700 [Pseudomonas koreensis]|uniref:hypothetical protein n=1 Tax=Pseudomonas koreensis TaxID=198620 RepID=UPI0021C7C660|nr:hypothetical protein [Pseudomonas koreensis]MCU0090034.1 hypothetical protein [Pseudomonas koreensis]
MEVYLDTNIYWSIANREKDYEYTLAKINNLFKSGYIFPHAPPHAEELSARFINQRDIPTTLRAYNLIKKFNNYTGYLPGHPNLTETQEIIREFSKHPGLVDAVKIHQSNLRKILSGEITENDFPTRLIKEDFGNCLARVNKYLDLTDEAKRNEMFHLGRRDSKNLKSNFEEINRETDGVSTFLEIQKRYNLGPRRLSRLTPEEILEDKYFLDYLQKKFSDAGMCLKDIPIGAELMQSHHQKEILIQRILDCMEEAGYNQEEKNHAASLTGRMHDVSHAIYASRADFLVTNDKRFSKKAQAAYIMLNLSTRILNTKEFQEFDLRTDDQSKY